MKTKIENGKIYVQSDYNRDYIARAKGLQGKWSSPYWVFPEENIDELRELLLDVYGECGDLAEEAPVTVTVELDLDEYKHVGAEVSIGSFVAVRRRYRDSDVTYADNVMLVKGGFPASGGSVKNPRVYPDSGTVIRVKDIPVKLYEKIKDEAGVTLYKAPDNAALIEERDRLLARLAELNALIGDAV